jgi:hypothetical protein
MISPKKFLRKIFTTAAAVVFAVLGFCPLDADAQMTSWDDFVSAYKDAGLTEITIPDNGKIIAKTKGELGTKGTWTTLLGYGITSTLDANGLFSGMYLTDALSTPLFFKTLNFNNFIKSNAVTVGGAGAQYRGAVMFIGNVSAAATLNFEADKDSTDASKRLNNQFTGNRIIVADGLEPLQAAGGAIFASSIIDSAPGSINSITLNFSKNDAAGGDEAWLGFKSNYIQVASAGSQAQGGALYAVAITSGAGQGASSPTNPFLNVNFTNISANSAAHKINSNYVQAAANSQSQGGGIFFADFVALSSVALSATAPTYSLSAMTFTGSSVSFDANRAQAGANSQVQGGGLFAAASVGLNVISPFAENSTSDINFTAGIADFRNNILQSGANSQNQGAGMFAAALANMGVEQYLEQVTAPTIPTRKLIFNDSTDMDFSFVSNSIRTGDNSQSAGAGLFVAGIAAGLGKVDDKAINILDFGLANTRISGDRNSISAGANSQNLGAGLFLGAIASQGSTLNSIVIISGIPTNKSLDFNFTNKDVVSFSGGSISAGANSQNLGGGIFLGAIVASGGGAIGSIDPTSAPVLISGDTVFEAVSNTINAQGGNSQNIGGGLAISAAAAGGLKSVANNAIVDVKFGQGAGAPATLNISKNTLISGGGGQSLGGGLGIVGIAAGGIGDGAGGFSSANDGQAYVSFSSATVSILNNSARGGSQNFGGGIFVSAVSAGGTNTQGLLGSVLVNANLSDILVSGNSASYGGGIFVSALTAAGSGYANSGRAEFNVNASSVVISNNSASQGGGLYVTKYMTANSGKIGENAGDAIVTFNDSLITFSGNTADRGPAIVAVNGGKLISQDRLH